ncbi:MAG TPA: MATE family efflux transporter [Verrucomicrobiae bacterium]|jgi:putative MATE family efflux protein|nr:MATE family efflux transporter [Verrucomicrobiae bacterium]
MAQTQARRPGINVFDQSKPMWKTMLIFLVPLMLSNLLQSASGTFGNIFLGRMIGVNALAAASSIFPVVFLLISFLIGIASGSTVLIGQAFGARDEHRVKKIAGTVTGATFALGIVVAIVGSFFSPALLAALGTPHDILADADRYARVVFLSCPIFFPYLAYTTFLRGTGDSTTPFYFLIVSTVLSIALTPVLIGGWFGLPKLGILGAPIAGLSISQTVAFAALLVTLARMNHPLKFDRETARDMLVDWKILWQVVRIGVPTGLQVMMVAIAEIAIIDFVNRYGSSATAAYGAVNQVIGYVQFPAISIGIAASIFGAQCIGAKREDLMNSVIRSAVALNYIIGGAIILVCYLCAWFILGWFITDPNTLTIAHTLLMITLWAYLLFGNSSVISGVMRSSGTVLWPTINGIFAIVCIEVPAAYILMQFYHLNGVWMGYPISYVVVLLLQYRYYTLYWKKRTHERLV